MYPRRRNPRLYECGTHLPGGTQQWRTHDTIAQHFALPKLFGTRRAAARDTGRPMTQRPVQVRVKHSSFGGELIGFAFKVLIMALELALWLVKQALVVAGWLWVNAVVPGLRTAARYAQQLAASAAARAARRRDEQQWTDRTAGR